MISESASAKVNLYLHVGGIRSDGFHELRSLFVFTKDGDEIEVYPSDRIELEIEGPFAAPLQSEEPENNLVWRAVEALRIASGTTDGARVVLRKNLPIASGIGGGSADAAATLRAVQRLWNYHAPEKTLLDVAFSLGADVPACLEAVPINVSGAGEELTAGPTLMPLYICLANPAIEIPTGAIFKKFDTAHPNPSIPEFHVAQSFLTPQSIIELGVNSTNHLQPYAIELAPVVSDVILHLARAENTMLTRMSGSGATCFALFQDRNSADACADSCRARGWWTMSSQLVTTT